jgi:hypothetical protein
MSNLETIKPRKVTEVLAIDYSGLIAHELANVMPMIEGKPFEDLKTDIAKQGILTKIVLFQDRILDGRNRYKAAKEIGYVFGEKDFEPFNGTYADAEAYVISTNMHRRQMTNAQKNEVIRTMILKYPNESTRQIAKRCGLTSHSSVAYVKEKMSQPTKDEVRYRDFCKTFDTMPDAQREAFVKEFGPDLRELLSVQSVRS